MRRPYTLAALVGLAIIGPALVQTGPAAADVLKYGYIGAFSGEAAPWGKGHADSIEIAINEINAGGGIKVGDKTYTMELKKYDHAYDPTKAVTATHQAVEQDGIRFLHVMGGGVAPAVQPVTEKHDVLLMVAGAGTKFLGKDHPLTFRPYYEVATNVDAMLKYLKQAQPDKKKVLMLFPDDDMGHSVASASVGSARMMGYEVKDGDAMFVARNSTDYFAIAAAALRGSPDVIVMGPIPPGQYSQLVKAMRQNGFKGMFQFSDTIELEQLKKVAGAKSALGALAAPSWSGFDGEKGKRWAAAFKEKYGSDQFWAVQDYDAVLLLKAAIEKAGTLDTKKVAEQLSKVSVEGAAGTVRFGGAGQYGLDQVLQMPIPVAEVVANGANDVQLKQVFVAQ